MTDETWIPWRDWTGGAPPVPLGTEVDACVMARLSSPRRGSSWRLPFTVITGDSFRHDADRIEPRVDTTMVYRFRVKGEGGRVDEIEDAEAGTRRLEDA